MPRSELLEKYRNGKYIQTSIACFNLYTFQQIMSTDDSITDLSTGANEFGVQKVLPIFLKALVSVDKKCIYEIGGGPQC